MEWISNGQKVKIGDSLNLVVIDFHDKPRFNAEFVKGDGYCFGEKFRGFSTFRTFRIIGNPGIKVGEIWQVKILAVTLDDQDLTRDHCFYVFIYVTPQFRVEQVKKSYQSSNGIGKWVVRTFSGKVQVSEIIMPAKSKLKTYLDDRTVVDVEEFISTADNRVLARRRVREYSREEYAEYLAQRVGKGSLSYSIEKATNRLPTLPTDTGSIPWTFQ